MNAYTIHYRQLCPGAQAAVASRGCPRQAYAQPLRSCQSAAADAVGRTDGWAVAVAAVCRERGKMEAQRVESRGGY